MQQMMSQLAMQGVNVQAIDTSLVAAAASPGQSGDKKHAFWDTQMHSPLQRNARTISMPAKRVLYFIARTADSALVDIQITTLGITWGLPAHAQLGGEHLLLGQAVAGEEEGDAAPGAARGPQLAQADRARQVPGRPPAEPLQYAQGVRVVRGRHTRRRPADRGVRPPLPELRRGRRVHVPVRLQPGLFGLGPDAPGLLEGLPPRREEHKVRPVDGLHHRRPCQDPCVRRREGHGRGKLPLRAQETQIETARAGPDQGDHAAGEPHGSLPGGVHGGVVLPGHVASCRYYHRTLEAKKLVEIGFTRLGHRMTMARMQKLYKLPTETSLRGLRPMTAEDVPAAHALLVDYLSKFKLSVVFDVDEFRHWLLPRKGVVSSFVNVSPEGEVTDFCSYYHLHSTVLGHEKHSTLFAAYSFYNVARTVDLTELMRDCLILAKNEGHDVFNALNLMENDRFLEELKFGMGDGNLQYYVYNWLCPTMNHDDNPGRLRRRRPPAGWPLWGMTGGAPLRGRKRALAADLRWVRLRLLNRPIVEPVAVGLGLGPRGP
ncbi:hypothetical protein THAOC_23141, partial [Thalassiosira oceanica]